jgi:hypothetical protein
MRENEDEHTGCSPYDVEIRRRCWWTLGKLSYHRVQKPSGISGEAILVMDVTLPLNVNDVDLSTVAGELPKAREGLTEMSLFLANLEVVRLAASLKLLGSTSFPPEPHVSFEMRRKTLVEESVRKIERDFLWHCDTSRPLDWFLMLTTKAMLVGRVWLRLVCGR